ncbi:hypothetical protein PV336_20805 [Streptomyces sp. MI02-2A]|uniref:hypothetical protein n=1 Tax=unclassified Streptomyces TaxID=2593676 RepID=UPI0007414255|nr:MULTISPECIES: hypothetical protein [unclassified Streptomyces]KUJ41481.1 hypothetical protein ADL25_16450 [Streptomyces sp. NRRL F-5122]MDX3261651.1 hypothetical protein [Streptomyces sp. MI02-2A]REE62936.1 hypothetical protein BX257_5571 [Streptomyces sp. 3212.3]
MSPRAGSAGHRTLAFVESPVQLLNVLEWAHAHALRSTESGVPGQAAAIPTQGGRRSIAGRTPADGPGTAGTTEGDVLTLVVLSPNDPMTRGQLRRMAELARDEGYEVRWEEARGGATAPFQTIGGLLPLLRRAHRVVMGDPFSRYVQLLLMMSRARDLVVVDDGTATMEFVTQLARGERLVRWHRKGGRRGVRELMLAPVSSSARRRLTPSGRRTVEVFSSMPIEETPDGVTVTANEFSWTRARFGPPRITKGADLVGTSLVETGVVDSRRYLDAVQALAKAHGARRYFAHRRESTEKLHTLAVETGLEVVRPDLPLELIARRGPIGRTVLSFPSTVVHTLPLALVGTEVRVSVCDIDPAWLTQNASPRAQGFLSGVSGTARDVDRLDSGPADQDVAAAGQDVAAG